MSDQNQKHPDDEIETAVRDQMTALALALDELFNGTAKGKERGVCFVLLTAHFDEESRVNYISNGARPDIVTMLKEVTARFEGQPEMRGRA